MTSTCAQSAPEMLASSDCRLAKSADRMLGLIWSTPAAYRRSAHPQQRQEHAVGAVPVRPQLGPRTGAGPGKLLTRPVAHQRSHILRGCVGKGLEHVLDHELGLGEVRRAGGVEH